MLNGLWRISFSYFVCSKLPTQCKIWTKLLKVTFLLSKECCISREFSSNFAMKNFLLLLVKYWKVKGFSRNFGIFPLILPSPHSVEIKEDILPPPIFYVKSTFAFLKFWKLPNLDLQISKSTKLISRKIWVVENFLNFHTVLSRKFAHDQNFGSRLTFRHGGYIAKKNIHLWSL